MLVSFNIFYHFYIDVLNRFAIDDPIFHFRRLAIWGTYVLVISGYLCLEYKHIHSEILLYSAESQNEEQCHIYPNVSE